MVELFYIYVGYCGAMSRQDDKLSFLCVAHDHNSSNAMLGSFDGKRSKAITVVI